MAAKRILTSRAKSGMVTADDVYTSDNQLVIPKGTVLTEEILKALKDYSIFAIRVEVEEADGQQKEVFVPEEEEIPDIKELEEEEGIVNIRETKAFQEFESSFMESVDDLKDVFNSVVTNNEEVDTGLLLSDVKNVISKGKSSLHILDMLQCMRGYSDTTYVHCMNVALLCNMIARTVYPDMTKEDLDVLTLAGLLCDIGKILVPEEITMKKGRLTISEYNIAKTHVFHGNNILKGLNLDPRIAEVAMRHHERCDGSGYPSGYKTEQIEEFARIVAIADTYDAMTSERVYRAAICPFEVIHMFEREGLSKYDARFLIPFLEKAVQAYINTKVLLSNGMTGRVIMMNRKDLARPVVKVKDEFIDLSYDTSIKIKEVLV